MCILLDRFGYMTIWTQPMIIIANYYGILFESQSQNVLCVSSFYELGSEISPRKELGSEMPRLYNQKVAESTFKSRPALTPRSLQSLPTTTISISFHKYHCYLRFPSTWYLSIMCVLSLQSCLTLCDPMDCSPPGSPVYGVLQARILEWVAMLPSRGSSQPRDQTRVSNCIGKWVLYH